MTTVRTGVGIILSPQGLDEPADLLRYADLALYRAKKSGRGTVVVQQVQTLAYDGSSTPGSPTVIQTIIALAYDGGSTPGDATVQPGNVDVQAAAYDGSNTPGGGTVVLLADAIISALAYDGSTVPGSGTIVSGGAVAPPPDVGYRQPR